MTEKPTYGSTLNVAKKGIKKPKYSADQVAKFYAMTMSKLVSDPKALNKFYSMAVKEIENGLIENTVAEFNVNYKPLIIMP